MTLTALAAAWVAGLLLGQQAAMPLEALALWGIGAAALWTAVVLRRGSGRTDGAAALHNRRRGLIAVGCAAALLLTVGAWWAERDASEDVDGGLTSLFVEETAAVRGIVLTDPERAGTAYRFQLDTLEVQAVDGWEPIAGRVQVTANPSAAMTRDRSAPHVRYGDRLTLSGSIEPPPVFDDFDYREYLARQGVGAVSSFPALTLEDTGHGNRLLERVYALRARLGASLERSLPEPASALARSLLLGQRRGLPEQVRQEFIETGTSHLLAISGLHVAIVLGAALALGRMLFGGARWALVLALMAIWVYALVSGMSPSVTRAAGMGSVFLLGRALGREGASLPALAAAAAAMTALDPRLLGNISFQLSFTAVAGLLLLAPPVEARLAQTLARVTGTEGLPAAAGRAVASALAAGIAATLGTLPLVALAFERVSYLGIPVTLLALPALPIALASAGITAAAGGIWAPSGVALGWVAWAPLAYLLALVSSVARFPGGLLEFGGVTPVMVWSYYVLLTGAAFGFRRWQDRAMAAPTAQRGPNLGGSRLRWAALALFLVSATVWTAAITAPDGRLTVTFLDVGQGDAIFIQTPSGKQILIDGGPNPEALERELGRVMPFWDRTLDVVTLTHPDADHLNGLVSVLERYDATLIVDTGVPSTSAGYAAWRRLVHDSDAGRLDAYAGQQLRTGDGVIISVLNPPGELPAWTPDLRNNSGVTLRVAYGAVSFLLPADIHHYAEEALVASGARLQATVLKAAHHGSATSSSQAFLNAVAPEAVVVSAGRENKFGHPSPEVVERLAAVVGEGGLYVTAERGPVRFATDGERLSVETER